MDPISSLFYIAAKIYSHADQVKSNTVECQELAERVVILEPLLTQLQEGGLTTKLLANLQKTLEEIEQLIQKHTTDTSSRWFMVGDHKGKFKKMNERLNQAILELTFAMTMKKNDKRCEVASPLTNETQCDGTPQRAEDVAAVRERSKSEAPQQAEAAAVVRERSQREVASPLTNETQCDGAPQQAEAAADRKEGKKGEAKMVDQLANSEANSKHIEVVEGCFGPVDQPLATPSQVLICEGVLTKLCRKKPKERQFMLFNDVLVYGNIFQQHTIPMESVTLSDTVPDEGDLHNGWLIKTPTKSFAVYAATATEKTEWMNHINKCVRDLLEKSGKSPTDEHAAVWVPDSEATVCMRCQKTKFSSVYWRHHCRNCGLVVCAPCSNKKYLLPNQSSKPVRVCEYCYEQLTKSAGDSGGNLTSRSDSISGPGSKLSSNLSDDDDEDDSIN